MRFVFFLLTATLAFAGEFTTSLGDTYPYTISAITTDSAGNTYVVGSRQLSITLISDFEDIPSATDVFVSKIDPNGKLLFTDTFGGKGSDTGTAIALDPSGNIYIAGTTSSPDFPLSNALQTQSSIYSGVFSPTGLTTGFIIKLSNDGATILYSTYFGGTQGASSIAALATDSKGNLYLTGSSAASDFPQTPGMPNGSISSSTSPLISGAIVAGISAAGDKILYAGTISGSTACPYTFCTTAGTGIALDASGNAYIAGNTDNTNLPATAGALSPTGVGAFVAKIAAGGTGLAYLTYVDSSQTINPFFAATTNVNAIAVDASGNAYLAGWTNDSKFPVTQGSFQPTYSPAYPDDFTLAFLLKLNPSGSAVVWGTYLNGGGGDVAQSIALDASGNVWSTGSTVPSFPNANGWTTGGDFLIALNSTGSKSTYSALYPTGTVAQSVALDPSGVVHVAGLNGFVSAISPTTALTMKIFDFQNAFGGSATAIISPAEVISIYGPGIGPATSATAAPTNGFYPTTLSGVQVAINGVNMPLLYVSANQINAVVPMETAPNSAATVHIVSGTTVSPDYPVRIVPSAAQALPTVLNQDGTVNSPTNPAKSNSIVTFYATGWQSSFSPLADGQVATTALDVCQATLRTQACQAAPPPGVYSPPATVLYGGAAPDIVAGVTQFNVQIGAVAASSSSYQAYYSISGDFRIYAPSVAQTIWLVH
jgi:uncharacterized protein (TIGR03437 family)